MSSLRARSLGDLVTFTRAGTANYVNSSGTMTAANADTGRVDYDPVTLAARGLLVEEGRTNLLLNSASLGTQGVTVTAAAHTLSFYGTGNVVLSGASSGSLAGAGTARASLAFTPSAGTLTCTVSGTVSNAQLELGAYATSYITTTGTSIARARDVTSVYSPGTWLSATAGTLFVEFVMPFNPPSDGVLRRLIQFDDASEANRITLYLSGQTVTANIVTGSSAQMTASLGTASGNVNRRVAFAWSANDCAGVLDGNSLVADTSATIPAVTTARLGNASASGSDLSGYLRKVRHWPRRLTDNELRALVA
jgi:hypothetical protein